MRSSTDLHSLPSLECLRHELFLIIFSRAGTRTLLIRRESTSGEAIPSVSRVRSGHDTVNYDDLVEVKYGGSDVDDGDLRWRLRLSKVFVCSLIWSWITQYFFLVFRVLMRSLQYVRI